MTILQRYVIKELIGPVLISLLLFTVLLLLKELFDIAERLLEAGVGFDVFLQIFGVLALTLLIITVPMSTLLGSLVGVGRLTSENEILAMRAAGIPLRRIFLPTFILATIASAGLMYFSFTPLPNLLSGLNDRYREIAFEAVSRLEPGRLYEIPTPTNEITLFYEQELPAEDGDGPYTLRMSQVAMRASQATESESGLERTDQETLIFAESGVILGDFEARKITLILQNGLVMPLELVTEYDEFGEELREFRTNPEQQTMLKFERSEREILPEIETNSNPTDPVFLTLSELFGVIEVKPDTPKWKNEERKLLSDDWRVYLTARNEIYTRFTLPWSVLAFVLIAIPLAVEIRPKAKTLSFFIALGLLTLYYVMYTTASALGMAQSPLTLPAFLFPNIFIAGVGIYLFWRVQK